MIGRLVGIGTIGVWSPQPCFIHQAGPLLSVARWRHPCEISTRQLAGSSRRAIAGRTTHPMSSPGWTILDLRRSWGKSLGLSVTMKSALPDSAQRQNASSFGSSEISAEERTLTSSTRSRIRLMTFPIRLGRTWRRFRTSLYSSKMSSVMSQTKLFCSAHRWSTSALGFLPETNGSLKPDMPATSTLVSTTARGLRFLTFCGNGDLWRTSLFTIVANCSQDFFFRDVSDIFCRLG